MADFDFPDIGIASMTMRLVSATSISTSPFTFDQQVYEHQGVRWEAEVKLPPLKRSEAKEMEAFLAQLRGQAKTFTLGNPLHDVTSATGSITSGSKGSTNVTGTVSSHVEVGDYFEINGELYILTKENASTLDIMPPLRTAISASTSLDFTLPKGTWRLSTNDIDWSINKAGLYGFSFACVEAI